METIQANNTTDESIDNSPNTDYFEKNISSVKELSSDLLVNLRYEDFCFVEPEITNEITLNLIKFKNSLIKCLGSIKQNYDYFVGIMETLDNIIEKLEEIILLVYSMETNSDRSNSKLFLSLQTLDKIYHLFIFLFYSHTNNTFYESFLQLFSKFQNTINECNKRVLSLISKHYNHYYVKIYSILVDKKIEYIDKLRDSKIIILVIKTINKIVSFLPNEIFTEEIKLLDLFNFLLVTKNNLFALSNDIFLDKSSDLILKIFKNVIKNFYTNPNTSNISSTSTTYCASSEDVNKITEIILSKMIEIAKYKEYKEELGNYIDYSQEIFYVNTLILCLRLVKLIISNLYESIMNDNSIKEKLTRVLIELSFWDSYSVVKYTLNLFETLWEVSLKFETNMRSNFEKLIEYLFVRKYQNYYNLITQNETSDTKIKLSVIEILTEKFNKLIENSHFLFVCYSLYDFSKIRSSILMEIFNSLQKYYSLKLSSQTVYLKKLITLSYLKSFNKILEIGKHVDSETNSSIFTTLQNSISQTSELWTSITKQINAGSFKKFYQKISTIFNLQILEKKSEIKNLDQNEQEKYKLIAKSIAIFVKYSYFIDISILYEVISDNHEFSGLILQEFCDTFDFRGLDILKAYEVYVSTFKLYGEPHNIYNLLMKFSKKYFNDNSVFINDSNYTHFPFTNEDQVSTLAYSILMLNTDLHNPNLTKHMTSNEFVKNNLLTKLFDSFPVEYFKDIYKSIAKNPLKIATSRINDYSKEDEVFYVIKSKNYYCDKLSNDYDRSKTFVYHKNIFSQFMNYNINNVFSSEFYPYINVCEDFSIPKTGLFSYFTDFYSHPCINTINLHLWEDLFYNFMTMPNQFYEYGDENILEILKLICEISQKFNQGANIDKLIVSFKYNKNNNLVKFFLL